jgi:hypothetical protein
MSTQDELAKVGELGGVPRVSAETAAAVAGGDGNVTSFADNGGKILQHARIVLVFWGSAWASSSTAPSQPAFVNALADIISGTWGAALAQYRGIGPMSLEYVDQVTSSDPAASFTNAQIQAMLRDRMQGGHMPVPSSSVDRVYCVLVPSGHGSGDTSFVGQHQFFDYNGTRAYYAWVTNDGTLTGGNSIPKIFSHEVAEALSDPDLGSGIIVNGSDEIGDVCNNTWSSVDGHAEEAYWSQADHRCVIPAFQALPAVAGNPVLIQGRFGSPGNFEMVVPAAGAGLYHVWRNNSNGYMPWSGVIPFGQGLGQVDAVTMIESNYGNPGNLEVIARAGGALQFFWRDSGPAFHWNGPFQIAAGAAGNPVLIQGRFGSPGNFEMVVPAAAGGLAHYWRDNTQASMPWHGPIPFGQGLGQVDAVTMIQSNYGNPGNLEVIARAGGALQFFWRDSGPAFHWNGPFLLRSTSW